MATQNTAGSGNSLDALASLLQLFQGTKTTSSSMQSQSTPGFSETTGTNMDEATLAGLLKSALESNQGLASTAQGQRSAGLYNSSTNRLMTNDLLSRLTARTAEAGASKTVTRTPGAAAVTNTTNKQQAGGLTQGGGGQDLAKLMAGIKLYNESQGLLKGGKKVLGAATGALDSMGAVTGAPALASLTEAAAPDAMSYMPGTVMSQVMPETYDMSTPTAGMDMSQALSPIADTAANLDFGTYTEPTADFSGAGSLDYAGAEDTTNFPTASANSSSNLAGSNTPSSSEVLSEAQTPSADTTSLSNATNTSDAASSYGGSISALSSGGAVADASGVTVDSAGNLAGYASNADITSAYSAADGTSTVTSADLGGGASTGGSILGYVGPVLKAINAQNNPKGEQNKDYRPAVGGAVLNYLGYGWATPIVHAVAEPLLNEAMNAGTKSMGTFGAVLADPIGAPLSGQYDVGELVTSTLDPANIFGGNPGGSVGSVVAAGIDPVGAALGGEGLFGVVSEATNTVDSALAPGRVVCTELALAGDISMTKYQAVIQPAVTLRGRILLGYHVLGIPAVRRLRSDSKFREAAIPYVNAYLDHKLGKWNLTGFIIKSIGEPLCWILSFFNSDPEAYKTLYPYRRNRNGT